MNPPTNYGNNQPIPAQNMYAPNLTNQIYHNQGNAYNANPQVIPPMNKPPISVTQIAPSEQNVINNKGYQQPDFSNQVYNPQNPYGYNFEEQAIPPMNNISNTM